MAKDFITINVKLDSESIEKAIKRIERYQRGIERQANELLKRLAMIGTQVVADCFSKTNHEGEEPSTIHYEKREHGYAVMADGEDVLFIEFGTGAGAWYPETVDVNVSPGSWSSTEGTGEYAKYGSWHHKKTKYTYSDPALGFVRAKAEILYQAPIIAKEIFGSDFG